MSNKKDFEIFLYKNKLNNVKLIDVVSKLSTKTVTCLLRDLSNTTGDLEDDIVYVFTDGNCKNNGKTTAKGGYAVFFTDDTESPYYMLNRKGLLPEPTNNKAELTGIVTLLKVLEEHSSMFTSKRVVICTDSMYSINCITKWAMNWVQNNWKTAKGENVKNAEIIKEVLRYKETCSVKIEFKHVYSHTEEPKDKNTKEYILWYGNHRVDTIINELLE